ncbi:MAG: hypothetical protein R3F41_04810 [Gammaproteobacteria bacterium]|nr:hypothetical protein [Pseudomonadales bacterium]MCP5345383.1 hypothetical protein [Pseudomonadales bacterium]
MSDSKDRSDQQSHKLGADRHDPASKPSREHGSHKTSKDVREDRSIRQSKLGKHKN